MKIHVLNIKNFSVLKTFKKVVKLGHSPATGCLIHAFIVSNAYVVSSFDFCKHCTDVLSSLLQEAKYAWQPAPIFGDPW